MALVYKRTINTRYTTNYMYTPWIAATAPVLRRPDICGAEDFRQPREVRWWEDSSAIGLSDGGNQTWPEFSSRWGRFFSSREAGFANDPQLSAHTIAAYGRGPSVMDRPPFGADT